MLLMEKALRWVTIAYWIVLTVLLEMPAEIRVQSPVPPADDYAHLITFTLLGFLVECRRKKSFLFWLVLLLLYSVGSELVQGLLAPICHRTCDLRDLVQDVAGILIGLAAGWFAKRLGQNIKHKT